jgi:hypothetical protein
MRTKLLLSFKCNRSAKALTDVLAPDNRSVPGDQTFIMKRSGSTVTFRIESDRVGSAFTSLDSVLTDASLFQEVSLLSRQTRGRDRKR